MIITIEDCCKKVRDTRMREEYINFINDVVEKHPFELELVGVSYCDGTYMIKRSKSKIFVFEYVIEGEGTIITESKEFTAKAGDVYFLEKGSKHRYFSDDKNPWVKIWFNARGKLIEHLLEIYKLKNVNLIQNSNVSELFFKMLELAKGNTDDRDELYGNASLIFHKLIIELARKTQSGQQVDSTAQKLKNYLDARVNVNVTIKELSDAVFLSTSQTNRIFKKAFGVTPYEYLLYRKVESAKLLLINTTFPVKEIAYKLNFEDEHYFSNYFKQKTGISPYKYRKSNV